MLDGGDVDGKIIAVAENDMSVSDFTELPEHNLKEFRNFFEDFKKLENKEVIVNYLGASPRGIRKEKTLEFQGPTGTGGRASEELA